MSHCLKRENQNLSSESLRGIVRSNKLSEVKSLSKPKSLFMSKSGQFLKDFSYKNFVFLFFTLTHNDRGYGLGRAAGEFPVAMATKECGRKDSQKHISRPKRIGVCYGFGVLSYSLFSIVLLSAVWRKLASNNDPACLFQLCLNALSARKMRKVSENSKVDSTQKTLELKRP
jgi:hypothetical protein